MKTIKKIIYKHRYALSSFFLPIIIMTVIFIFESVYPFGNQTLFTIDLGQQYVDFFAEYKTTLSSQADRLIYSFNKGIGGEMTGLWAYYLMSPLNFIFLITPANYLDLSVTILILLRYGLAGWSMNHLLRKINDHSFVNLLMCSTAYSLSAYLVNYQFNLMWNDGVILLPLIILGLEKMLKGESGLFYSLMLGLMMVSNYYIAYMICIFLLLYFLFRMGQIIRTKKRKEIALILIKFFAYSLLAAGLACFILLPTAYQLQQSKIDTRSFDWDFSPKYPIQDLLSKLYIASFNFDQIPDGLPNIFVSSFILIHVYRYFFNSRFHWSEKIQTAILLILLCLSMNLNALNKIWHGFQNPNWFPYRFSFVFIFMLILIAYRQISHHHKVKSYEFIIAIILSLASAIYVLNQNFDYLNPYKVLASFIIFILYFLLLFFDKRIHWKASLISLCILTVELTANASLVVSELSYVDRDRFVASQTILNEMKDTIERYDPPEESFYRIEKTFQRTKNDSHQANYKSASHFGSTYEARTHELFSGLGLPAGSGFSAYTNGTLLTDSLFGIKYYVADKEDNLPVHSSGQGSTENQASTSPKDPLPMTVLQSKPDLACYDLLHTSDQYNIYQNPNALSLAFKVHENLADIEMVSNYPIIYQNLIAQYLNPEEATAPLFTNFSCKQSFQNVAIDQEGEERVVSVLDPGKETYIEATFQAEKGKSYYYVLNGLNDSKNYDIYVNGQPWKQYGTIYDDVVVNLEAEEDKLVRLRIELKKDKFYLSHSGFYSLDYSDFQQLIDHAQERSLHIDHYSNSSLQFQAQIEKEDEMIMLTIPYDDAWKIKANGQIIQARPVMDTLMGIKLKPGKYDIQMTYQVPHGHLASTISGLSWLIVLYLVYQKRRKNKLKNERLSN